MKLEPAPQGYGPWALIVAPILVLSGFILGIVSIFSGPKISITWKNQSMFLVVGWLVFGFSFIIYMITLEETASLWDCAEFIACAYKLQVPHAPGAPLFLLVGRMFSLLAFGDEMTVAYWVNVTSALSSAFTVMFTFWTVIMLARKLHISASKFGLILAGLVGAFSIAFADSFWFSAVEAETYAMATLFLIVAFWAILKWEKSEDKSQGNRWLIFIFYILGLSVGVHPMSLLVLPAIALVIIFRKREFSLKNLIIGVGLGVLGIFFLNHIVLFGLPDLMKYLDVFFVNSLGLAFYSGAAFSLILLIAAGLFFYRWSIKKNHLSASIFVVGMMYFLIGYSSYFMIIIRSQQDPSIDENNPENLMTLTSYLKRESYGSRPFLHGQHYTAKIKSFEKGAPVYTKMEKEYQVTDHKTKYIYEKDHQTILPRMYSNLEKHIETYQSWTGLKDGEVPGFIDNLQFMIQYQFGHMYFRYLMFNFSGRESDIQHASWLGFWDNFKEYPDLLSKNKAHNNFLMLPFIIGLFGMFYQYRKDRKSFWALMAFFLFLGLILNFYLNSPPNEPRERDYIYVGSYLAFAVWCGIGAFGFISFLNQRFSKIRWVSHLGVLLLVAPMLMLYVGFDDHNRSGRMLQVDHARNVLNSCAPNAILFTGGDNDTFPLWYAQEVEGFRTDVRVIVLSYFNGDWYIDQMQREMYESEPLPFSLPAEHYRQGGLNDVLPYVENPRIKGAINLRKFMELVEQENPSLQVTMSGGSKYNSIPSRTFFVDIDKQKVIESGIVPFEFQSDIPGKLLISWNGNFMEKSAFMVLNLLVNNDWERPIYFNTTSLNSIALDLKSHVLQEGQVYRLLPIQMEDGGQVNTDKMYENLMLKSEFRDLAHGEIYYNHEDYQLRILQATKSSYNTLASKLIENGELDRAKEVIKFLSTNFVKENIELDYSSVATVELLFRLYQIDQGKALAESLFSHSDAMLNYLQNEGSLSQSEEQIHLFILRALYDISVKFNYDELAAQCSERFNEYVSYRSK